MFDYSVGSSYLSFGGENIIQNRNSSYYVPKAKEDNSLVRMEQETLDIFSTFASYGGLDQAFTEVGSPYN